MKHMKLKSLLAATLLGVGSLSAAQAEETEIDGFAYMDVNGNDCIDWEELRNYGVRIFHALDQNHDGIVTGEEHPEALDINGNLVDPTSVSIGTFQASWYIAFRVADKDGDKCLNRAEMGVR